MSVDRFSVDGGAISEYLHRKYKEGRGEIKAVQTPWRGLDDLIGGGLRQGEISVVAGPGGNGKTNFALNIIARMAAYKRPALYMPLEDESWEIMARVCGIVFDSWECIGEAKTEDQAAMIEEVVCSHETNTPLVSAISSDYIMRNPKGAVVIEGERVYAPKLKPSELLDWLNSDLARGKDLIVIDPISMVNFGADGGNPWEAQEGFVQDCHAIAKHHGFHLMMLAHIRKRQNFKGKQQELEVDDIQGSAAFNRHTRYVLMLDYHRDWKESTLHGPEEDIIKHKHTMYIAKANFGAGTGRKIAFAYSDRGPQFYEKGIIKK